MSKAIEVTSATFEAEVLKSEEVVLVDFWAPWCGPCKMLSPIIDEIADEYAGKVKIVKLNIDDSGDIATKYGVMSIPTLILFKNGDIANKTVGLQAKPALKKLIDSVL